MTSKLERKKITWDDLEHIYQQNQARIFRLAFRIFRNVEDAEDLVNDTFMQVLKNYHEFRGESDVSTWVYGIAVNETLQKLRRRSGRSQTGKRKEIALDSLVDELIQDADQETIMIRNQYIEKINQAFKDLCADCQTVLFLWFHDEVKGVALADLLNIPVKDVYKKKEACLNALRARILPVTSQRWRKRL